MESLVNALKDTPIPTILVLAGIFFLVLAVADQIAGKVVIDPSRRKNAVGIGSLLLVAGVVLQFVLKSTPSSPAHGPEAPDAKHTTADDTKSVARPQVPTAASHSGEMSTVALAPNDSIAAAKNLEIPSIAHEKHKSISDKRYFKFTTAEQPSEKLRVLLRDLNRDSQTCPWLIVFDRDEREIFNNWDCPGNQVFVFSPKPTATYFVLAKQNVNHATSPAEYDIAIAAE
jgi:hypothetical protein